MKKKSGNRQKNSQDSNGKLIINYQLEKSHKIVQTLRQEMIVIGLLMTAFGTYALFQSKGLIQSNFVITFSPIILCLFGIILIALAYWEKES
ncbi:MAG: hypothetical protein QXD43_05510 [Candidatus Aenigmatarchaeota archaeon]